MSSAERGAQVLLWLLKLGLGGLFLWAGWIKLQDPTAFAEEIANYQLLPQTAPYLAAALPTMELVLGAALIVSRPQSQWLQAASLGSAMLYAVFTIGVTQVVLRGIDTSCGCFGAASGKIDLLTVGRVVVLMAACLGLLGLSRGRARRAAVVALS